MRPEFSEFTGFCLSDFLKSTEIRADNICFVPSRKTDHWLQFYLNKVDRARVFAPLVKNPLKLSQKLLNRSDRIENSMNLFRGSDDFKQNLNSILLIDDVLSTGNSLQSAIKELKSLGYKNISVLVFTYQEIRQGDRRK
ncbi:hypothetical protein MJH12_07715 [bacterium]|nr:hypothetical protein [bacterium]